MVENVSKNRSSLENVATARQSHPEKGPRHVAWWQIPQRFDRGVEVISLHVHERPSNETSFLIGPNRLHSVKNRGGLFIKASRQRNEADVDQHSHVFGT